tara:strand:- start:31 stop:306 length:276 start_codon:yes stop_codon:yes gene_type:complete
MKLFMKENNFLKSTKESIQIIFFVLLMGSISSCTEKKPTICECHKAYMDNVSAAIYTRSGATSSKVDKCLKYFTETEMIYADDNHGCVSGY